MAYKFATRQFERRYSVMSKRHLKSTQLANDEKKR